MINENLKDSPFKVMQINLGSVQINNPSLNLLSSKISLELANVSQIIIYDHGVEIPAQFFEDFNKHFKVEVILMPVLNVDESKVKSQ